ncbi:THO complex subunit 3-like [Zophobas morio]|uniref:THO complex subunit 3-like n=1 Tax=Zophobas morio TaxID=2755281 RepID=UPI0030837718
MTSASSYITKIKKVFVKGKTSEFKGHSKKVNSISWNCEGKKLASGSSDNTLRVWDLNQSRGDTYNGHFGPIEKLCWNPSSTDLVATASLDRTVRIWDIRASKSVKTIETNSENINIDWSPDGSTIAVGNKDDQVIFIDAKKWHIISKQKFQFLVNEIKYNKNGNCIFLTNGRGCVCICQAEQMALLHTVVGHTADCTCIAFDKTGKYFATGGADSLLCIWDAEEFIPIRVVSRYETALESLSFSYDGSIIAVASESHKLELAYVETGECVMDFSAPGPLAAVSWHPSKHVLAYAGVDNSSVRDSRDEPRGMLRVFSAFS